MRPFPAVLTSLATLLCIAATSFSAFAQPLMRQSRDIKLIGGASLPGMLAVTLVRGKNTSIRYLDLEQRRVLEFPSPVPNVGFPSFSPDGDSLTFVGQTRKGNEIFTSSWSGESVTRVTFNTVDDGDPSFTVEGDAVTHYSETRKYKSEIFSTLLQAPYTRSQLTAVGGGNTTPSESPDNRYLLYTTDRYRPAWNICLVDQFTKREVCPLRGGNTSNCRAHWSPDGSQFVYTLERGPTVDLHLFTLATRASEKLTRLSHKEYDAVWSPDGKYIAFAHEPKGTLTYDLKVVRVSDKAIIPLAKARSGSLRYLSWSSARLYTVASDACPADPKKMKPGTCGCGLSDTDTDNDTVPDCIDEHPLNPRKHRNGYMFDD
jgi:Tol biopolymer transport system component